MLFNSYTFLFLFLPITLLGHAFLGARASRGVRVAWLTAASLVFYAYFRLEFLWLLLGSIVFNYAWGGLLSGAWRSRRMLALGVIANLGLLGYYKYAGLLTRTLAWLVPGQVPIVDVMLPIGISFFTFQQIAYLVDTWSGRGPRRDFVDYCLFVTFFPQLIAGPIVHHEEILPQLASPRVRMSSYDLAVGSAIFFCGLAKKVLIADGVAVYASPVFAAADGGESLTLLDAWFGVLAYTLQIYFDFSGYSDMAIGLGRMFGVVLPINFDSPYKARDISEFWRRWHITLSRFLRDYLYIPLGGNRHGTARRYVNLMVTMLLGGLWHGAAYNFVIWGGIHGALLVTHQAYRDLGGPRLPRVLAWATTLASVILAWVFFRAETLGGALDLTGALLGSQGATLTTLFVAKQAALPWLLGGFAIVLWGPSTQQLFQKHEPGLLADRSLPERGPVLRERFQFDPTPRWALVSIGLVMVVLLRLSAVTEFIYFQF